MREIKFRAIDWSFKKKWVYGHYFNGCVYPNSEDRNYIYSHDRSCWGYSEINELTLGQFTGLKDSLGNEIYEGDIIIDESKRKAIVKFGNYRYKIYSITYSGVGFYAEGDGIYCSINKEDGSHLEIIGNIHVNETTD